VALDGVHVRLEPLSLSHLAALTEIGLDPDLWRWTTQLVRSPQDMEEYVKGALAEQLRGVALPFATVHKGAGQGGRERVVGSTRFGAIEPAHRKVEIGWTWIGSYWQRSVVNTEAKYLMLRHAFETWGCVRVEFKTDRLNEPSRRALLRIGATEEGILRAHLITAAGRVRDSVYFSIIAEEWPAVKAELEKKLRG